MKGMDDIMKMVGEQAAALLGAESDEERQRIRDNFKAKQETVIKSMATAASDRYSGVGHLAAYTEKKDLNKSITYKKLNITLQYVEKGPEFQGSDNKPKKDYLLVGLKIYNGTDEQKFFFSERELRLITEKGEETKVRWFKADESYAPKSTYSGFMLFLVPKSEKKFTIQFGEKNKQIVSIQLWL